MSDPGEISIRELRALHEAPKNVIEGNMRMATQPQMDFYFAAHKALPALIEAVEAARTTAPFLPPLHRDALNRYLAAFSFEEPTGRSGSE